jgi:hypothetical protein
MDIPVFCIKRTSNTAQEPVEITAIPDTVPIAYSVDSPVVENCTLKELIEAPFRLCPVEVYNGSI